MSSNSTVVYREIPGWTTIMTETSPGTYIVPKCNDDGTTPDFAEEPEVVIDPHKTGFKDVVSKEPVMSRRKSVARKSQPPVKGDVSPSKEEKDSMQTIYSEPVTKESSLFNRVPASKLKPKLLGNTSPKVKIVMEVSGSPFRTISYVHEIIEVTDEKDLLSHLVLVMDNSESENKVQLVRGPYQMAVAVEETNSLYLTSLEDIVSFVHQNYEYYVLRTIVKGTINEG